MCKIFTVPARPPGSGFFLTLPPEAKAFFFPPAGALTPNSLLRGVFLTLGRDPFHIFKDCRTNGKKGSVHFPLCTSLKRKTRLPPRNSDTSTTLTLTLTLPTSQARKERCWSAGPCPHQLLEGGHLRRSATFRPFEGSAPVVTAGPTALLCRPQREPRKLL